MNRSDGYGISEMYGDCGHLSMIRARFWTFGFLAILAVMICTCSKETNPAVPGAPEEDVITIVDRNPLIRVGLLSFTPQKHLYISVSRGTFKCYVGESLQPFTDAISGDILKFTGTEETIELTPPGDDTARDLSNEVVRIEPDRSVENAFVMIGTNRSNLRSYRGKMRLVLEGKTLLAINELPLEEYLLGVVPAEMDPEWPEEALKAQAVASRSYAIFNLKRYDGRGFDLADDERSQEYGGVDVETDASANAVMETTNQILTYENRLAVIVFHEESGGQTASNLDVWPHSGEIPYLAGVSDVIGFTDFSSGGRYDSWSSWAGFEELRTALNLDGETFTGEYLSCITILGRGENGRVQTVDIIGEKNSVVSGMTFIQVLNRRIEEDFAPSNLFKIKLEGEGYRFTGSGKGHGVGMSQWGAYQRASNQQTYEFILSHYFPGCEIIEIPLGGIEVAHNTRIDTIR